jgi:adenine-specific DNA-methyltransferase
VGHHLKGVGYQVRSNDLNTYAYALASCYVQADQSLHEREVRKLLKEMSKVEPTAGYFTKNFCEDARFFQPHNGAKIDAMRDWIDAQDFDWERKSVLLVALMEAADRVDSTCGIQMAYLKKWANRSFNDLELRMPVLHNSNPGFPCRAYHGDALVNSAVISGDVAYLDPPYNQHKYLGNYHIWESLIKWDKPEVYGIARKRTDVKERHSSFNRKREIHDAMRTIVNNLDVKHFVVSFNNEGYIDRDDMVEILETRGQVSVVEKDFKRYVGATIGIHSPKGEKVGEVSHVRNLEYLFVVSQDERVHKALNQTPLSDPGTIE